MVNLLGMCCSCNSVRLDLMLSLYLDSDYIYIYMIVNYVHLLAAAAHRDITLLCAHVHVFGFRVLF